MKKKKGKIPQQFFNIIKVSTFIQKNISNRKQIIKLKYLKRQLSIKHEYINITKHLTCNHNTIIKLLNVVVKFNMTSQRQRFCCCCFIFEKFQPKNEIIIDHELCKK
eukprot:TRINITY_DN12290_c0_g3_i1.p3 TRINITY_DN12290_c0_g3~~TRINITY_DN12290_c0_g3_i1.p3  ORF type:complete len:107 (+),score=5.88 TRINITY_DN12290_c0_g3_i1:642-962(+)